MSITNEQLLELAVSLEQSADLQKIKNTITDLEKQLTEPFVKPILKPQSREDREKIYKDFCDLPPPSPTFLDAAMENSDDLFSRLAFNY